MAGLVQKVGKSSLKASSLHPAVIQRSHSGALRTGSMAFEAKFRQTLDQLYAK